MEYLYINPQTKKSFVVKIHNFHHRGHQVKIEGSRDLNPSNLSYPDRKWVETKELLNLDGTQATFTEEFIKLHSI